MNYAAVDYESYFDEECSIRTLGTDGYILHPAFYVYLVSITTNTGLEYVGPAETAPWDQISGNEWTWLSHNASFDERVHQYLLKWGKVPSTSHPGDWHCTADLCAFSAAPRALAKSAHFLYGIKVSKDYRALMKGKHFKGLSPENQKKVTDAGVADARTCLKFWEDLSPNWPTLERWASRMSREQAWKGYRVDIKALDEDIRFLSNLKCEAERLIPWHGSDSATFQYESLVKECKKVGIDAPPSTAMTSDECAQWEDTYGDQYPWIDALRTARRVNVLLHKCRTMRSRVREEDGRMPYQNKYFGAHTGRWGDGSEEIGRKKDTGFNSRNLPRQEMFGEEYFLGKLLPDGTRAKAEGGRFAYLWVPGKSRGVNLRNRIIPEDGCHFVIADLSQIEPRCQWRAIGDYSSLGYCKQGMSPYEAHARSSMGYEGGPMKKVMKEDLDVAGQYQLAKARVLALGYNAGWIKFIQMAPLYVDKPTCEKIFSAPVSERDIKRFKEYLGYCGIKEWDAMWATADEKMRTTYINSWKIVMDFRHSNPKIASKDKKNPGLWKRFDDALRKHVGKDFKVQLPSGRFLIYRKIAVVNGDVTGIVMKFGNPTRIKLYGGLLTENYIQAIARDVFVECLWRIHQAGIWVPGHIHDEAVTEVPLATPASDVEKLMSQSPSFWPDLPVASEAESHMFYTK
jgi:hypothetical protein